MELALVQTSVAAIMDGKEAIAIHVSQSDLLCSHYSSFEIVRYYIFNKLYDNNTSREDNFSP